MDFTVINDALYFLIFAYTEFVRNILHKSDTFSYINHTQN